MNAQLISSDTLTYSDSEKSYTLVRHNGAFPSDNQFQIGDRLFFCDKTGVYEQTAQGINLVEEGTEGHFPFLLVEDENASDGYKIVYAVKQNSLTYIDGSEFSDEYASMNDPYNLFSFLEEYVPNKHVLERFYLHESILPNPEDSYYTFASVFGQDGFMFQKSVIGTGLQVNTSTSVVTPNGFSPTAAELVAIRSSRPEVACLIKGELFFGGGKIYRIRDDNARLEEVVNDFNVLDIGNWNDELVIFGSGRLSIGYLGNRVDISDILMEVQNIIDIGPSSMRVDCNNNIWFTSPYSENVIELILEESLLDNFVQTNNNLYFNRYEVTNDTSEFIEQGEKIVVVKHEVRDVISNTSFAPHHVIDAGGDVFVSSDFAYLRRQQEGLVPVLEPNLNEDAYYIYENDDVQNQLYPFKFLNRAKNVTGYQMVEYINDEVNGQFLEMNMLNKLMEEGDGRAFKLWEYKEINTIASLGSIYSLTGIGDPDGEHLIEMKENRTWQENGCISGEYNHDVAFNHFNGTINFVSSIGYDACTGSGMEEFGGHPRDFIGLASIKDSLTLFPRYSYFYNSKPFSLNEDGETLDYKTYYDFIPITVDEYKGEPIMLAYPESGGFGFYLIMGHIQDDNKILLSNVDVSILADIQVTEDHHIWLTDENSCYEIIREQDQGVNQELRSYSEVYDIDIEVIASCSDTSNAIVELQFSDSQFGAAEYNIYLDRELVAEVSNAQTFELPLVIDDDTEQTFHVCIQLKDDHIIKECETFSIQCVVDQDGDGFTSEVDCDDTDPSIYPGAEDIPGNDIDEDCDGADLSAVYEINGLEISIYPNPVAEILNVQLSVESTMQYQIVNIDGKIILSGSLGSSLSNQIDLYSIPTGIYYLELKLDNSQSTIVETLVVGR